MALKKTAVLLLPRTDAEATYRYFPWEQIGWPETITSDH